MVYGEAEMAQAVGNYEVWGAEHHIVARDLVENLLRDLDMRSLVLYDHARGESFAVEKHRVAAACRAVERQRHLVGHERGRVTEAAGEPCREVAAHPFLRGESHELAAQGVEDTAHSVSPGFNPGRCKWRQVESRQVVRHNQSA